jgi:hypothetical protein
MFIDMTPMKRDERFDGIGISGSRYSWFFDSGAFPRRDPTLSKFLRFQALEGVDNSWARQIERHEPSSWEIAAYATVAG